MLKLRAQSFLLFTRTWRENSCINTFPKGISAMRNVNRLDQLSEFLRRSVMIDIIKGFQIIVFISRHWPICSPASSCFFVELGSLLGSSNHVLYLIHRGLLLSFHNRVQVLSIPVLSLASSQD